MWIATNVVLKLRVVVHYVTAAAAARRAETARRQRRRMLRSLKQGLAAALDLNSSSFRLLLFFLASQLFLFSTGDGRFEAGKVSIESFQ